MVVGPRMWRGGFSEAVRGTLSLDGRGGVLLRTDSKPASSLCKSEFPGKATESREGRDSLAEGRAVAKTMWHPWLLVQENHLKPRSCSTQSEHRGLQSSPHVLLSPQLQKAL